MNKAEQDRWFPVRKAWPDVCDGRVWEGSQLAPKCYLKISPSAEHPGFFHYETIDIVAKEFCETRRPVAAHALCCFLEREGLDPEIFRWTPSEALA